MKDRNFIYSKLVRDDADIIGIVAYGFYKKHKIEFIKSVWECHKREPNDDEWAAFNLSSNTDSQLEKYIHHAEGTLATFVMDTTGEQIKTSERKMLEQYQANIKAVLPSNTRTVLLSILGSFIFSIIISICIFLGVFSEKDKADLINRVTIEASQDRRCDADSVSKNDNPGF